MAAWTVTGQGTHAVVKPTQHLLIDVDAYPANTSFGEAYPTNYYHLGFIRCARGAYVLPAIPIHALQMLIDLGPYVDNMYWALKPGVTITVTEANN